MTILRWAEITSVWVLVCFAELSDSIADFNTVLCRWERRGMPKMQNYKSLFSQFSLKKLLSQNFFYTFCNCEARTLIADLGKTLAVPVRHYGTRNMCVIWRLKSFFNQGPVLYICTDITIVLCKRVACASTRGYNQNELYIVSEIYTVLIDFWSFFSGTVKEMQSWSKQVKMYSGCWFELIYSLCSNFNVPLTLS